MKGDKKWQNFQEKKAGDRQKDQVIKNYRFYTGVWQRKNLLCITEYQFAPLEDGLLKPERKKVLINDNQAKKKGRSVANRNVQKS